MLQISRISGGDRGLYRLATLAESEGFGGLNRLLADWHAGTNRFQQPGEALLGCFDGALIAVGGLNVDPFSEERSVGRLRHLYVDPTRRRSGVGRALVVALLDYGHGRFERVRLRTYSDPADQFYAHLGFSRTDEPDATHTVSL